MRLKAGMSVALMAISAVAFAQQPTPGIQGAVSTPVPQVNFPATPTPRPTPTPMTAEALETHVLPREISTESSTVLALVYNGGRRSQVGPCGCVSKQLGGIDKEAQVFEVLEKKNIPTLGVDAGGYLKDVFTDFDVVRSKAALKAMGVIGYDAVNVGYTDLGAGVRTLRESAEAAGVPLVSANILDASGNPVFEPYRVENVELGGKEVRVGVVGVTRPRLTAGMAPRWTPTPSPGAAPNVTTSALMSARETKVVLGSEGETTGSGVSEAYTIGDPIEALNKYLPELKDKSDLIVLLSYNRRDGVKQQLSQLGELGNEVDIAVAGEYSAAQTSVQMVNQTRLVSGGYEGRQVGLILMDMADGRIQKDAHKWIEVEQSIPSVPEVEKIVNEAKSATTGQLGGKSGR